MALWSVTKISFFVCTSFLDNFLKEARMGKEDRVSMRPEFFMRSTYQSPFPRKKKLQLELEKCRKVFRKGHV